jgi:hypothetical protein
MGRTLALIALICLVGLTRAQEIKIPLNERLEDGQFVKSQAMLPMYKFESPVIEKYTRFGVDEEVGTMTIRQFPDMSYTKDTGYTFIYFSGADNEINQGYVLALVGDYRRIYKQNTLIHVDRNNNLDFTDDGPADTLHWKSDELILTFNRPDFPEAKYELKISRFPFHQNPGYRRMLDKHYKQHSGTKQFTSVNYSFREQRYNTRGADFKSGNDSFTIAIKDFDVNGFYNESCVDMLYVGAYQERVDLDHLFNILPDVDKTAFEWNGKKYSIVEIDPYGRYIRLKVDPDAVLSNKLEVGKKVPKFTFKNTEKEEVKLRSYRKKPVYIYFWEEESLTAEDTLYLHKIYKEFGDEIGLITLNHGDKPKQVLIFEYFEKISWPIGFSTAQIADQFFLEDVNRGYYLGKKLKLIDDKIGPKEMYELLQSKE